MRVQEYGSTQSGHASVGACLYLKASLSLYSWPYMNFSIVMPSLWEFRIREWSVVPNVLVRAPWVLALMMSRLEREVWCRLLRVDVRTLRRSWSDGLVKTCMHSLSFSGIVHHGGRSVAECGPVAREMGVWVVCQCTLPEIPVVRRICLWRP